MCDLDLVLERSPVWPRIERLYHELERKHLVFRPHCWISDEWYTPDGVPGIAIPFYLVHPRLAELERSQMREVEGGTVEWCMRILRHETGHAMENAFRLRRRHRRQELFGKTSKPYPKHYAPKPYSKRYVLHLEAYYAQSHPDEDFAETFAVWLTPKSGWRRRYAGWPALRKLEYVDELMHELAGKRPVVPTRRTACAPRCATTIATSGRATASTACGSTTPPCASSSRPRRRSRATRRPPASCAARGRSSATRSPISPASTSTPSTSCWTT